MSNFVVKCKTSTGHFLVNGLTSLSKVSDLKRKLYQVTCIDESTMQILCGFPPKLLDLSNTDRSIESCGIKSGDTLIVEGNRRYVNSIHEKKSYSREQITKEFRLDNPGILRTQVVPPDNSCLFTSIGFVMTGVIDLECSGHMRGIIAQSVSSDSENYSEAILGKPNKEYCAWIQKPDSWGGAIELAVMSQFYGLEIGVIDTLNAIINLFGEDKHYAQRVFLLFDGIHYDPMYLPSLVDSKVQTIFSTSDERVLQEASAIAREANASGQYTDLTHFTLRCLVCQVHLTGQVQAQKHAKETGHASFGEIGASTVN